VKLYLSAGFDTIWRLFGRGLLLRGHPVEAHVAGSVQQRDAIHAFRRKESYESAIINSADALL